MVLVLYVAIGYRKGVLAVRVQMLPAVALHPRSHPTNQPRHYEYSYSYKVLGDTSPL